MLNVAISIVWYGMKVSKQNKLNNNDGMDHRNAQVKVIYKGTL